MGEIKSHENHKSTGGRVFYSCRRSSFAEFENGVDHDPETHVRFVVEVANIKLFPMKLQMKFPFR
jgi:hypothetical protein